MIDPKEKEAESQSENVEQQDNTDQDSNWNEHQRIDEEGNELEPDDIK
ncbi:hypothetical protein SAMN05421827_101110 [Pedobacter terrae]|uniref:Uncharacterized protein n=1 Tax=Pedobacter terrae TaxID=405671 RepID=A0A1G7MV38_9SPHI|nr:hypothetical protein [Pedobacter terrae]SDF65633.1 hypothetical protein SAMN05421827_101110 [Pedobacter terrae]